jgi:excisionase family DNA binding protein
MSDLFTIPQTATQLKIADITLRRLIQKRAIPFHRIGAKYLFTGEDIAMYLEKVSVPMAEDEHERK